MSRNAYDYIIIGGGLAGGHAALGIREQDREGSVLLIGSESHPPYDRPPLTKKLWFGKKTVEEIFVLGQDGYREKGIELALNTQVVGLDRESKSVTDSNGISYHYGRLLLATGGAPRRLAIPGGDLEGIYYYRYLHHYLRLRPEAHEGKSALVVGGGFIGSEIALPALRRAPIAAREQ